MDDSKLYLSFDDFKLWLNKYSFVRDMVREALMPKIWSLQDHKKSPEINITGNINSKNSQTSKRMGTSNSAAASLNIS